MRLTLAEVPDAVACPFCGGYVRGHQWIGAGTCSIVAVFPEPLTGMTIIEHALLYAGGSMLVRPDDIEQYYPLAKWIESHNRQGAQVYRRTVGVIKGWERV